MVLEGAPRLANFWEGDLCRELLFLRTVDKEVLLSGENKPGGDSLEKTAGEVHGLRKRRGAKLEPIKPSVTGDSVVGKMPEEEKRGVANTGVKDASTDSGQEPKQPKPLEKKTGKQGKGTVKPSAVRRVSDTQPSEELRAKEEAETNRKVHESLDNFIKTIRCEPYMSFTGRPVDKPLQQRLRPDVFENHVPGKFARGFKVDGGSDPRDSGTEENLGLDSGDVDGLKDASNGSTKSSAGLSRGSQHSLKVPPGVVAFTQAAAKGTDLQGWLSPSKIPMTKCEKCSREFCSTLNYRRHVRVHRRSLNPEKEDLSKERSKVAAFWDKLTSEEASSIVHYGNMEIEELSGQSALKALMVSIQQSGVPSLPQGILKAGASLLDIVQNKASAFPLSSERLLNILDDASEKTFLCGGTSVAVQRFVFNGDAGKVALEEKNLVASMGFHIELKLVKAWMADKEDEALRCQQALFKEEEAAEQKRAKLLEKKRMKKIRQKERKGSASQLVLQELENESIDDEGNIQGIGEEDDSPTATGSSSSSLASAQDLAVHESADMDLCEDLSLVDAIDEHVYALGEEPAMEKNKSMDEGLLLSPHGRERSRIATHLYVTESFDRKDDSAVKQFSTEDMRADHLPGLADEVAEDADPRLAQPSIQNRSGRTEVQSYLHYRKGEQDRAGSEMKRRESERPERKTSRVTRERSRNDFSESVHKHGKDIRGFDGRYGDGPQTAFKSARKSGIPDLSTISRLQPYRSKLPGMNRTLPTTGNGQVVWTRKIPQTASVEATKDRKEGIRDDAVNGKVTSEDGWEVSMALPEVSVGGVTSKLDEEVMKEDVTIPASVEVSSGNDSRLTGSSSHVIPAEETTEADDEDLLNGALLVGSLSVPLGKFGRVSGFSARSGSSALDPGNPDYLEVSSVSLARNHDQYREPLNSVLSTQEVVSRVDNQTSAAGTEGSDALKSAGSPPRTSGSKPQPIATQTSKLKPHLSLASPERGDGSRHNVALPIAHERLAAKQGSWQTPVGGRYVSAKVWRAVGMVGDRHDSSTPGLQVAVDDSGCSLSGGRPSQDDVDLSGRSESGRETSPKMDPGEDSPTQEDRFFTNDSCGRNSDCVDQSVVENANTSKDSDDRSFSCALLNPARPLGSHLDVSMDGTADILSRLVGDNGVDSTVLASGPCSSSAFVEFANMFFNQRWKMAVAHASVDDALVITEGVLDETDGFNFLETLFLQLSNRSIGPDPGGDSLLPPPSPVVIETLEKPREGLFLSRTFGDSDLTGVGDVRVIRRISTSDDQRLDGAGAEDSGVTQAVSSEDDTGMREASSSPVDSEHYMSGSDTSRNATPSASLVRSGEKWSEGGGSFVSSHARLGSSRQERGYRNPRDRLPEQRYMPRRRAPVEKNC